MNFDEPSDAELLRLIVETDKILFDEGVEVSARQIEVPQSVMRQLGYVGFVFFVTNAPPVFKKITDIYTQIYRQQDLAWGGHIGVFMYRDIFARVSVPHAVGRVLINPLQFVDLTPLQLKMMCDEPDQLACFLDQFCDLADIQYGSKELIKPYAAIDLVTRYLDLSMLNLHAAAAVLTGGFDPRGGVQSAILATELALKAAMAALGHDETYLKEVVRHQLKPMVEFIGEHWPQFDTARVSSAIGNQPQYVQNRYSPKQPERRNVGHIIMGAQYVTSEVTRQMSRQNFRGGFKTELERVYPLLESSTP